MSRFIGDNTRHDRFLVYEEACIPFFRNSGNFECGDKHVFSFLAHRTGIVNDHPGPSFIKLRRAIKSTTIVTETIQIERCRIASYVIKRKDLRIYKSVLAIDPVRTSRTFNVYWLWVLQSTVIHPTKYSIGRDIGNKCNTIGTGRTCGSSVTNRMDPGERNNKCFVIMIKPFESEINQI